MILTINLEKKARKMKTEMKELRQGIAGTNKNTQIIANSNIWCKSNNNNHEIIQRDADR